MGLGVVVGNEVVSVAVTVVGAASAGSVCDVCDVFGVSVGFAFVTGVAVESDVTAGLALFAELLVAAGAPTLVAVAGPILSSNPSSEPLTFR